MPPTKYNDLCLLTRSADDSFGSYEKDCAWFKSELRKQLVEFLQCSDDRVIIPALDDAVTDEELHQQGVVEVTLDRRMTLYDDAFYGFKLRIRFGNSWLDLGLKVQRVDGCFLVKLGPEEWRITKEPQLKLGDVIQRIYGVAREYLETRFDYFVHGKPATWGFVNYIKS